MTLHYFTAIEVFMPFLQDDIMLPDRILHQYEAAKKNTNAVSITVGYTTFQL
jgi:hypothetical protein